MTPKKKPRRDKGDGSIYLKRRIYWIAYIGPDGKRKQDSTGSDRFEAARRVLRKRIGAVTHNRPCRPLRGVRSGWPFLFGRVQDELVAKCGKMSADDFPQSDVSDNREAGCSVGESRA